MRSWWMQLGEGAAQLEQRDVPVPQPGARQLLVRVRAASLNRGEFVSGHGLTAAGTWKAVGTECAGEVAGIGAEVTGFGAGDRVMARCAGGFSEYALVDVGEAHVIGTSTSQPKLDRLKRLGLEHGLCTRGADFASQVLEITGQHGADLVINIVGGSVFAEDVRCMAFEGRLATVGYVDGQLHADIDLQALHARRLTLFGVSNKLRSKAQKAAAVPRFVAEVLPLFASGALRPLVDDVLDFPQLPQAKARMEAGGHIGKIVLRVAA